MTSQELIRRNKTISRQKVTVIKTVDGMAPEVPDSELVHEDMKSAYRWAQRYSGKHAPEVKTKRILKSKLN